MSSERWRMASSLLLSLLIHGLLLSLTFGGQGLGLPGLGFPWQERRVEVPELRVVLVPAPITPAEPAVTPVKSVTQPTQQASIEPPVAGGRAPTPPASPAPLRGRGPRDRPRGQAEGRGQARTKRRGPCRPCESALRAGESRSRSAREDPQDGRDRRGAVRQAQAGRAYRSHGRQM